MGYGNDANPVYHRGGNIGNFVGLDALSENCGVFSKELPARILSR